MILIADSGSTKTDWAVVGAQERAFVSVSTQGINPLLFTDKQIDSVLSQELYPQLLKAGVEIEEVSDVYFYGAGCTVAQSPRVVARLSFLFSSAKIEAESDLLGAARAVLGHNKGVACILGTGANSCLFDGQNITAHTPPLGYVLGDEGSGAVLGRNFLNGILKGWLPTYLRDGFFSESGQSYDDIIDHVYRQPLANRYLASIAPFILRHIAEPALKSLVAENFEAFFRLNVLCYSHPLGPIACVGGIAWHFRDILAEVVKGHGLHLARVMKSPIEGLVEYYKM